MKTKLITVIFVLFFSASAFSQFRIQKVSGNLNTSLDGIVYSLPQTVIKLNISLVKTEQIPGPLAEYSSEFLGVTSSIERTTSSYSLLDVNISSFSEMDPDQLYYLQFPTQKTKDEIESSFQLSSIGSLVSYNAKGEISNSFATSTTINQDVEIYDSKGGFDYNASYNRKKVVDTIIRKINIDTVSIERFIFRTTWANLSEKDKANEAALKIQNIREQRFNLLTGFQEVNYGGSIVYMDGQLKKMENDYLQLFLGRETKSIENYTLYIVPTAGEKNRKVLEIGNGASLDIEFKTHGNTSLLPEKPLLKDDYLYYRMPENSTVNIKFNGKLNKSEVLSINQFGKLLMAPLKDSQLYFDANSGNLIKMVRK